MSARPPLEEHADAIARAVELLDRARYTVVLVGAGMSKESGIPTFRGEGGLWTTQGEPPLNQYETFAENPARWWERRLEEQAQQQRERDAAQAAANEGASSGPTTASFAAALEAAQPNAGHLALAELERMGVVGHVITQNVDDLHRRAGQQSLTEIHGNRFWMRCVDCGARWPREEFPVDPAHLPPRCTQPACAGIVKGDTVMFGEPIPVAALDRCARETWEADCFMSIGTSAVVYPAAQYPISAVQRGVPLIEVNPEPTPLTPYADAVLPGPSGVMLPAIVDAIHNRRTGRAIG